MFCQRNCRGYLRLQAVNLGDFPGLWGRPNLITGALKRSELSLVVVRETGSREMWELWDVRTGRAAAVVAKEGATWQRMDAALRSEKRLPLTASKETGSLALYLQRTETWQFEWVWKQISSQSLQNGAQPSWCFGFGLGRPKAEIGLSRAVLKLPSDGNLGDSNGCCFKLLYFG